MDTGTLGRVYRALSTLASPMVAAGLAASPRGRRRFSERLGDWGDLSPVDWWLHGASVGEVQGLRPFISEIRSRGGEQRILLSSSSPTGLDRAGDTVDFGRIQPIDAVWAVSRALSSVRAQRFLLAETELWPNLIQGVLKRHIPCYVINGRISDYTLPWYRRCAGLFAPLLNQFAAICVVDSEQRRRYVSLGVREELIRVTGHTKYDTEPRLINQPLPEASGDLTFWRGGERVPTIVLGSLRPGEENVWLAAYVDVYRHGGRVRLILAPRHMEKVEYFAQKIAELGIPFSRWSQRQEGVRYEDVILLDSMGKLEEAYAIADLAFVGGTLVNIGGHNPLEPAMYGIPVAVGQYTSVIRDIVQAMRGAGGVIEIGSACDVGSLVQRVMSDDPELKRVGKRGESVWQSHRGAAKRVMSVVAHD